MYVSHCRLKYGRQFRLCWGRRNESAQWIVPCLVLLLTGCNTTILVTTSVGETKPHLQYYEKLGWSSETRRQNSAECGAIGSDDRADIATTRIKAEQRQEETEREIKGSANLIYYEANVLFKRCYVS